MPVSIAQRLDNIEDLPTIPHTLHQVLTSLDKVSSSAQTLEAIIREDPVLTAKILKMANSPYYGLPGEISSIARAVVILGFEEVKNLVIGLSLTGAFTGNLGIKEFDSKGIWLHSVAVAITSKILADSVSEVDPDELFTAGLIHDIGRLLMCLYFPKELREILDLQQRENIPLAVAEERYGLTHGEIGAYLTQKWQLSDMLVNVVRYHHHPQGAGPYIKAASIIFLADEICHKLKIGWSFDYGEKKILVPKSLGLNAETIKKVAQRIKKEKEKIEAGWLEMIK